MYKYCKKCNKKFSKSDVKHSISAKQWKERNYCSRKCYHSIGIILTLTCPNCKIEFKVKIGRRGKGKLRFCSHKCSSDYYSGKRNGNWSNGSIKKNCPNCNKKFTVFRTRENKAKFCSMDCYSEYHRGEKHHAWQDGKSYEPYSAEFNSITKEKIRKRDNYECQLCGITEEEHIVVLGEALAIHHIDYNKKNNLHTNLLTLCKQCNSRANYNRDYWEAKFKQDLRVEIK